LHHTASRVPRRLFESLGSADGMLPVQATIPRFLRRAISKKIDTAYRQLARWCWGLLGKEVRVVLPSCAVCCTQAHFPPPGLEEDFVFEGFHFPDK